MNININKNVARILFVLLLSSFGHVLANEVKEDSFNVKISESDIVVVASVVSVSKADCPGLSSCANIKIWQLIKGKQPASEVWVLFDGPIAENHPKCCHVGNFYLLFLENLQGNFYRPVNGPFGAYEIGH